MNRKQILILLILVAVVGGLAFYFQKRNQSEWAESAAPANTKVLEFPINDVARVEIRSSNGDLHLAKKNDIWIVEERDYPADFERVSQLVRQLWELRPVQQVKVGPSQFARLDLVEPGKGDRAGSAIEFKDKDGKTLAKLIAGKQNFHKAEGAMARFGNMPAGRYVLSPPSDKVSLVDAFIETDTQPRSWLKRDFVKIDNPSTITVAGQTAARHWTLTRADKQADWKLMDAPSQELDKATVGSIGNILPSLNFIDVLLAETKPEQQGLDKPDQITVQDFDRFTYAFKIGHPTSEAYPVEVSVSADLVKERTSKPDEKPEDKAKLDKESQEYLKQLEEKAANEKQFEKRIYLVPKSTLDTFLKDRSELFAKKPSPTPAASPNKKS
jgi:Domain of unknown function (DUF4340)